MQCISLPARKYWYASVPGTKSLRQEVANRVQKRTGVHTTANNVIITPGGQAGLFATHVALAIQGKLASLLTLFMHIPHNSSKCWINPRMVKTIPENNFIPSANELTKTLKMLKLSL